MSTKSPPPTRDEILARARKVLDLNKGAVYLGVSKQFLRRRIADRSLPAHQVGRLVRVYVDDLDALRRPVGGA